jgi:predicted lipoprotein with Yx(FWY)xxD motif
MKNKLIFSSLTIVALILSACASTTPMPSTATVAPVVPVTGLSTDTPVPAMPTDTVAVSTAAPSGPAVVNVAQNSSLGSILVDVKGMTLYLFTQDTPNTSTCYGGCVGYWPPLLTSGAPVGGMGVSASMLGTTKRTDGTTQVTYNGWPLYYFASDKSAGDTTGEGVQNAWYVVTPDGMKK